MYKRLNLNTCPYKLHLHIFLMPVVPNVQEFKLVCTMCLTQLWQRLNARVPHCTSQI